MSGERESFGEMVESLPFQETKMVFFVRSVLSRGWRTW